MKEWWIEFVQSPGAIEGVLCASTVWLLFLTVFLLSLAAQLESLQQKVRLSSSRSHIHSRFNRGR